MIYLYYTLIIVLSSFLWRVRGGLRFWGHKAPLNKIWYALGFACYGCVYFSWNIENFVIGFLASFIGTQAYGWGLYAGRLIHGGELKPNLTQYRECELIDDLLYSISWTIKGKKTHLYEKPRLFGFLGMTLTGLIISFLMGLFTADLVIMISGLGMELCYLAGIYINKLLPAEKNGELNCGHWLFGAYLGAVLAYMVL